MAAGLADMRICGTARRAVDELAKPADPAPGDRAAAPAPAPDGSDGSEEAPA
jgi:hypothetical protein